MSEVKETPSLKGIVENGVDPIELPDANNVVSLDEHINGMPFVTFSPNCVKLRFIRKLRNGEEEAYMQTVCNTYVRLIGRGIADGEECRVIEYTPIPYGKKKVMLLPMGNIGTAEGRKQLQAAGIAPMKAAELYNPFCEYLMSAYCYDENGEWAGKLPEWTVITRTGWTGDIYTLANGDIIAPKNKRHVISALKIQDDYGNVEVKGTSQDWCKYVAPLMKGNPFLMLAVGVSLAGVLLDPLNVRGFGIHLSGSSSKGKTTAELFGASVIGKPVERVISWDTTPFALGHIAAINNSTGLFLDEIKQAKGKELVRAIYGVFNGQLRAQGNKDGTLKAPVRWNTMILSTGELTVDRLIRLVLGDDVDAGALIRLLNLTYEAPQNLHGCPTGKKFAEKINALTAKYHGAFGRDWIGYVANPKHRKDITAALDAAVVRWQDKTDAYDQGAFSRAGNQFALLECALKLATKQLGIELTEIESMLDSLFTNWLNGYTSDATMSHEESNVIARAQDVLSQIGRFPDANRDAHAPLPSGEVWGYRGSDGFYYVLPKVFEDKIAGNMNQAEAWRLLEERGMLTTKTQVVEGREVKRYSWQNVRPHKGDSQIRTFRMRHPEEEI